MNTFCKTILIGTLCGLSAVAQQGTIVPRPAPLVREPLAPEPELSYGRSTELPLPKTILFSASPDEIAADAQEWARRGINAFFMDYVARDWSANIWGCDGKPWTIGASDDLFQKAAAANQVCKRIGSETFLKIAFDYPFEWFNDTAWQHINHNFRQFAIFARDSGCTGIALDIEYAGEQYRFDWKGYDYAGYTRKDLADKVRERMTEVMRVLYDEFPDMVFLTFPEQGFTLGMTIHAAWLEEAARRNAPGGFHYCTEFTYRRPNIRHMFGHAWACNELFSRVLSAPALKYWRRHGTIAAGVWPFGFDYQDVMDPGMTLEEFRQAFAASLMMSPRYNWIYSHNCRELLIGRALDRYSGQADIPAYLRVIADKEMVTSPKYIELAKELRANVLRDYSTDLGLLPSPGLVGPGDSVRVNLVSTASRPAEAPFYDALWDVGLRLYKGERVNLRNLLPTQVDWMVIGPFPSDADWSGHDAVYPPEQTLDMRAEYDGVGQTVRWREYTRPASFISVDFKEVFEPTERVTAYALCYVTASKTVDGQIRIGTNDMGKVWLGNRLIYEYPYEGSAELDRDIIDVTFPPGPTPLLVKVTNGLVNWGFICRFTNSNGEPLEGIRVSLRPEPLTR